LTTFFKLSPPNFSSWDWKATAKFSHDLKSNIQVSCNGPDWKLLLRGRRCGVGLAGADAHGGVDRAFERRRPSLAPEHQPPNMARAAAAVAACSVFRPGRCPEHRQASKTRPGPPCAPWRAPWPGILGISH